MESEQQSLFPEDKIIRTSWGFRPTEKERALAVLWIKIIQDRLKKLETDGK